MVGDEELRRAHTAVFTLMTSRSTATHTAYPPSIAAVDAVNALLVDAKLQYQSVTCILEVSTAYLKSQVPGLVQRMQISCEDEM